MGGMLSIIPARQMGGGEAEGKLLSKSASFDFLPTTPRVFIVLDSRALVEGLAAFSPQQFKLPCLGPTLPGIFLVRQLLHARY